MQIFLCIIVVFWSCLSRAENSPRSMIQIGSNGFGASGSYEKFSPKGNSTLNDFDILKGNVTLNYTYRFTTHLQLGLFISNINERRSFQNKQGAEGHVDVEFLHFGLQALWNFSENLFQSYYLGIMYSRLNYEDENSHTHPFDYLEDDRSSQTVDLIFGKRFSLKAFNLQSLSYSPSINIFTSNSQKDFDDEGIDESYGITLNLIKFDVFF